jgi:hypothetical protein
VPDYRLRYLTLALSHIIRDRAIFTKRQGRWKRKKNEKNFLPFVYQMKKNVLPCYLILGKNVGALLLCHNFLQRFIP